MSNPNTHPKLSEPKIQLPIQTDAPRHSRLSIIGADGSDVKRGGGGLGGESKDRGTGGGVCGTLGG